MSHARRATSSRMSSTSSSVNASNAKRCRLILCFVDSSKLTLSEWIDEWLGAGKPNDNDTGGRGHPGEAVDLRSRHLQNICSYIRRPLFGGVKRSVSRVLRQIVGVFCGRVDPGDVGDVWCLGGLSEAFWVAGVGAVQDVLAAGSDSVVAAVVNVSGRVQSDPGVAVLEVVVGEERVHE